jgi:hypothetical protein
METFAKFWLGLGALSLAFALSSFLLIEPEMAKSSLIFGVICAAAGAFFFFLSEKQAADRRKASRGRAEHAAWQRGQKQIELNNLNELHRYNEEAREEFDGLGDREHAVGTHLDEAARHYSADEPDAFWNAVHATANTLTTYGAEVASINSVKRAFEHVKRDYKGSDAPPFSLSPSRVAELRSVEQKSTRLASLVKQALANPRFAAVHRQRNIDSAPPWNVADRLDELRRTLTTG